MTAALKVTQLGMEPHFKVRVVFVGAIVHLASQTEPVPLLDDAGLLVGVITDAIGEPSYLRKPKAQPTIPKERAS